MNLIISLISLAFDILLLNVFKFGNYNISFFYPMFTITSIIYISNNYTSILEFLQDENNLVIDYMRDFFDAYFGKIEYGNIQEYIVNNLPEMT